MRRWTRMTAVALFLLVAMQSSYMVGIDFSNISTGAETYDPAPEWPGPRGGPQRLGRSQYHLGINEGELLWSRDLHLSPKVSPAVDHNGNVIIGNTLGELLSISGNGTVIWTFGTHGRISKAASIDGVGRIYFGSSNSLYCLRESGVEIWNSTFSDVLTTSALVTPGGKVIIGDEKGNLRSLRKNDGSEDWMTNLHGTLGSAPSLTPNGSIVFSTDEGDLYCVSGTDGRVFWHSFLGSIVRSEVAVLENGTMYCGSYDGNLYCIDPNGTINWKFTTDSPVRSSPAVDQNGTIIFGNDKGVLYFIGPDGVEIGRKGMGGKLSGSPVPIPDGTVIIGTESGIFGRTNRDSDNIWHTQIGMEMRTEPVVSRSGRIFQSTAEGHLLCLWDIVQTKPSPPTDVIIESGEIWVDIGWGPPLDLGNLTLLGYRIYRSDTDNGTNSLIGEVGPDEPVFADMDVEADEDYFYTIRAYNSAGESKSSEKVMGIPFYSLQPPSVPRQFRVYMTETKIEMFWLPPDNEGKGPVNYYRIFRREPSGEVRMIGTATEEEYQDDTAIPKTTYFYSVRAVNLDGEGASTLWVEAGLLENDRTPPVFDNDWDDAGADTNGSSSSAVMFGLIVAATVILIIFTMRWAKKQNKKKRAFFIHKNSKGTQGHPIPDMTEERKNMEDTSKGASEIVAASKEDVDGIEEFVPKPKIADLPPEELDTNKVKALMEGDLDGDGIIDDEEERIIERILELSDRLASGDITREEFRRQKDELVRSKLKD